MLVAVAHTPPVPRAARPCLPLSHGLWVHDGIPQWRGWPRGGNAFGSTYLEWYLGASLVLRRPLALLGRIHLCGSTPIRPVLAQCQDQMSYLS